MASSPLAGQRLRIAVLNRDFSPSAGGAERYSMALVEQLARRHEIHVFAQTIEHHWPGVSYHRVSCPMRRPRWINQLWYALASWWATRGRFDLVHSHENTWHGQVQTVHVRPVRFSLLAGLSGFKRALRWLKIVSSPRLLTYVLLEKLRFRRRPGRRIVVVSASLGAELLAAYPDVGAIMSVITPGIDVPVAGLERAAARRLLGLPEHGRWLLFVANDYEKKGLGVLLEALAGLPADIGLLVVGHPAQIARFREQSRALGLQGRVHFAGSLEDVAPAYRAADCLAHPTTEDSFAMVVLEAMAHGLPVVVSGAAYCGIASLLHDGEHALLLPDPRDAPALGAALLRALNDAPLRARLIQSGLIFAAHHQWSEVARRQDAVYQDAIEALRPRA